MIKIGVMCVLTLLWCAPRGSMGQPPIREISGPFGIPLSSAVVEHYSAMLGLDADQKQMIRTLYQGYRASFRQTMSEADKELKQGEEGGDDRDARMNRGMESLQRFAAKTAKLEADFLDDVRAVLTPAQLELLPKVERSRRREVLMRYAFVAGEGSDILAIMEQMKLKREGEVATACDEYEASIDYLMKEKQKVMQVSLGKANKIAKNGMPDFELVTQIIADLYAVGGRIRDMNRQYARRIEPLLPEDRQKEFAFEFKKRSFPRVYSPTFAQKFLKSAAQLDDLTPEQRTQIKSVEDAYVRDLEGANQRLAAGIESIQERIPKEFMVIMQARFDPDQKDPYFEAKKERENLQSAVFAKLRSTLTQDQYKKLPQFDEEATGMPDFIPDLRNRQLWKEWDGEDQ